VPDTAGSGADRPLLGRLLPAGVAFAEAGAAQLQRPAPALLDGEEEGLGGKAVAGRRAAYRWGRALARRAMADLGQPPAPVLRGARRQPLWPAGLAGAITHCRGYCAAAVARTADFAALGIDAEVVRPLSEGVLRRIAGDEERSRLAGHPGEERAAAALFSAKEAVYKAWSPLTGRWLGFKEAVVDLGAPPLDDRRTAPFVARILVDGPVDVLEGSYGFEGDLVLAAVSVPQQAR
jgi:4'-phosphopantetheinyl transferase EntD